MSWSFQIPITPGADFAAAADQARSEAQANIDQYNAAGADQADLAVKIAKEIVASGAIGKPDDYFYGYLSGHGNPNHEPADGMAGDVVTINVGQALGVKPVSQTAV